MTSSRRWDKAVSFPPLPFGLLTALAYARIWAGLSAAA